MLAQLRRDLFDALLVRGTAPLLEQLLQYLQLVLTGSPSLPCGRLMGGRPRHLVHGRNLAAC